MAPFFNQMAEIHSKLLYCCLKGFSSAEVRAANERLHSTTELGLSLVARMQRKSILNSTPLVCCHSFRKGIILLNPIVRRCDGKHG